MEKEQMHKTDSTTRIAYQPVSMTKPLTKQQKKVKVQRAMTTEDP